MSQSSAARGGGRAILPPPPPPPSTYKWDFFVFMYCTLSGYIYLVFFFHHRSGFFYYYIWSLDWSMFTLDSLFFLPRTTSRRASLSSFQVFIRVYINYLVINRGVSNGVLLIELMRIDRARVLIIAEWNTDAWHKRYIKQLNCIQY